jgi:hypothetical protein
MSFALAGVSMNRDMAYYQERARAEFRLAELADDPAVARSHYLLAERHLNCLLDPAAGRADAGDETVG